MLNFWEKILLNFKENFSQFLRKIYSTFNKISQNFHVFKRIDEFWSVLDPGALNLLPISGVEDGKCVARDHFESYPEHSKINPLKQDGSFNFWVTSSLFGKYGRGANKPHEPKIRLRASIQYWNTWRWRLTDDTKIWRVVDPIYFIILKTHEVDVASYLMTGGHTVFRNFKISASFWRSWQRSVRRIYTVAMAYTRDEKILVMLKKMHKILINFSANKIMKNVIFRTMKNFNIFTFKKK